MSRVFEFHLGTSPVLISIPHDGRRIPPRIAESMTSEGAAIPDTDWHLRRLYDFAKLAGASVLAARYSRYVVDLNRPYDDETLYQGRFTTGLFPERSFAGDRIYAAEPPDEAERRRRLKRYWQPYHDQLSSVLGRLRDHFGYAVLWEAHSIRSRVPMLFEGTLPELNIGTAGGGSCSGAVEAAVAEAAAKSPYSHVLNGRFKGGYITRHYGMPAAGVHALQLELAQRAYMNEASGRYQPKRAAELAETLKAMLAAGMEAAAGGGGT